MATPAAAGRAIQGSKRGAMHASRLSAPGRWRAGVEGRRRDGALSASDARCRGGGEHHRQGEPGHVARLNRQTQTEAWGTINGPAY